MELLNIDDLARLTGMSRSGLAKWRASGSGPAFIKIGRAVRYCRSDVEAWLASRRRAATWETVAANYNAPASTLAA
jgi:predicted DNA-binding transcriptional regulator AlpA